MFPFCSVSVEVSWPDLISACWADKADECLATRFWRTLFQKSISTVKFLVSAICNCSEDLAKSSLMLVTVHAGGGRGLRNACETASIKPPKCWNVLLTSKYFALALRSWILWQRVSFCCVQERCAGCQFLVSSTPSTSCSCIASVLSLSVSTLPICCCLLHTLPLALLLPLVSVGSWTGTLPRCGPRGACLLMTLVTMLRLWVATVAACAVADELLSMASKNWNNLRA